MQCNTFCMGQGCHCKIMYVLFTTWWNEKASGDTMKMFSPSCSQVLSVIYQRKAHCCVDVHQNLFIFFSINLSNNCCLLALPISQAPLRSDFDSRAVYKNSWQEKHVSENWSNCKPQFRCGLLWMRKECCIPQSISKEKLCWQPAVTCRRKNSHFLFKCVWNIAPKGSIRPSPLFRIFSLPHNYRVSHDLDGQNMQKRS